MGRILIVIWLHWFADFVLQPRKVADNKSKYISVMALHSLIYTVPFLIFGWYFAVFNGMVHFVVDCISSTFTKYFWEKKNIYAFFTVIGADQAIHISTLIITISLLV